jgi:Peptidase family S41
MFGVARRLLGAQTLFSAFAPSKGVCMLRFRGIHLGCVASLSLACSAEDLTTVDNPGTGSGAAALRDMSAVEAGEDLEQIFTLVRTLYGPYEYKEARFGYSIAKLEDEARAKLASAPGDDGFYTVANWFLSRFDDGHVSLLTAPSADPVRLYVVGIVLQPVDGKALVAELIDPSLAAVGVAYGDEVVSVDGVSPFSLLDEFRKLDGFGNPLTNQHLIYQTFIRQGFAASIRPTSPTTHVDFRRADGSEYSRDLIWRESREGRVPFVPERATLPALQGDSFMANRALAINNFARGSIATLGSPLPFFYTAATSAAFDITPVTPNSQTLARYGLDPSALPDIFAALYTYAGKTLLLIRQAGYSAGEAVELNYYRAILDQYESFVDGLVVDQTHNPGGFLTYCIDFARLFTSTPGHNFVEAFNADRSWVNDLRAYARLLDPALSSEESLSYELRATRVEAAYDAGQGLANPQTLFLNPELPPDDAFVWTKPRLVLIDELAGSCGDVFPMLVKSNHLAPLFGRRTMGLGGNVEGFGPLTNSQASLNLTRGLFTTHQADETYAPSDFVENNGVTPDIEHVISVPDFRNGFVEYMTHFSQVLASQIDGPVDAPDRTSDPE